MVVAALVVEEESWATARARREDRARALLNFILADGERDGLRDQWMEETTDVGLIGDGSERAQKVGQNERLCCEKRRRRRRRRKKKGKEERRR